MKHLGDITKINGAEVPIVDIVCGGSPCQDLSVAGQRKGLQHSALGDGETTRSGLFMEQIRIIKEMRDECIRQLSMRGAAYSWRDIRPRYMVWENVPGAFSSNKGEDFRCVLEETVRIIEENAVIPRLEGGQKWSPSGAILGDGWSVAWRVHDAQFWGVPQRRKRISLVADFGGESAPKILFERKGLSGDIAESREEGQGITTDSERSIDKAISFQERAGKPGGGKGILIQNERTGALSTLNNQSVVYCLQGNGIDRADTAGCNGKGWREGQCYTLNTVDRPAVCSVDKRVYDWHRQDTRMTECKDVCVTCAAGWGADGNNMPYVLEQPYNATTGSFMKAGNSGIAETLEARDYKDPQIVYGRSSFSNYENRVSTLKASGGDLGGGSENLCINQSVVRRLTPLEYERLQGFPDHWTDIGEWIDSKGKKHKDADSPRYKALGNSIALPFWEWMADRMVRQLKADGVEEPTMASLFDGIGGFPLSFSRCGCKPIWASEIEEFPIAVTKIRFPERE